jgi:hypothetical protein
MENLTERNLGYGFGLIGGGLLVVAAIVSIVFGTVALVSGHPFAALNAGADALLLFVIGGLAMFFAYLAHGAWKGHPLTGGLLLLVTAGIGSLVLALNGDVIALIGAIFVFLAGVLFLVEPARSGLHALATA